MEKKYSQTQQVIDTLRANGGYSTLGNLYHLATKQLLRGRCGGSQLWRAMAVVSVFLRCPSKTVQAVGNDISQTPFPEGMLPCFPIQPCRWMGLPLFRCLSHVMILQQFRHVQRQEEFPVFNLQVRCMKNNWFCNSTGILGSELLQGCKGIARC